MQGTAGLSEREVEVLAALGDRATRRRRERRQGNAANSATGSSVFYSTLFVLTISAPIATGFPPPPSRKSPTPFREMKPYFLKPEATGIT